MSAGERVFEALSERLQGTGVTRADARELRRYKRFFEAYPQIRESVTPEFVEVVPVALPQNRESVTPRLTTPGRSLIEQVSFTHLVELLRIEDALERAFYEVECIRDEHSGAHHPRSLRVRVPWARSTRGDGRVGA